MVVSAAARIESGEDLSVVVFRHCRDVGIEHMTFVPSFWPTPQGGGRSSSSSSSSSDCDDDDVDDDDDDDYHYDTC